MIRHISPILQKGLGAKTEDVQELCLDIVALLFKQFSGLLSKREDLVKRQQMEKLFCNLQSSKHTLKVRRKASNALGTISLIMNQTQLNAMVNNQINDLSGKQPLSYLEAISCIASQSGQRLSGQFATLITKLQKFTCKLPEDNNDDNNQLVQTALTAIENLILKCPQQAEDNLKGIYDMCTQCISYDPGYTYNDDEDANMDDEDYGDWGDDDDDAAMNDDSTAWKVRKGAVKVINSVIKSCPV